MDASWFWSLVAALACGTEAGLAWRYNRALPATARWQGYALGLGTLAGAVAGYALQTGQGRRLAPVALIAAGGAAGTLLSHAWYAAQDRADVQATEAHIDEQFGGARLGARLPRAVGTGDGAGAADRPRSATRAPGIGHRPADPGGRRPLPLYPKPPYDDPGHRRGSV